MANITETRNYERKPTNDCYQACLSAIPKAGFKVWKERPIAWLVLATKDVNGKTVEANLSVRFGPGSPVTVNIRSENLAEADLRPFVEELFAEIELSLK